jgi:hypothetical protein
MFLFVIKFIYEVDIQGYNRYTKVRKVKAIRNRKGKRNPIIGLEGGKRNLIMGVEGGKWIKFI